MLDFLTMIRRVGRIGGALVGGAALFVGYDIYKSRNPPDQLPFDPKLKTVCILGTGWAATSILKDIDTTNLNVVVVSPRNYFLFTPLLPSCTVGTADLRSIMQPIRYFLRFKKRQIAMVEGECTNIDPIKKQLVVEDNSLIKANVSSHTLKYDYLVIACGSENATFGIPGVAENSCFLKEAEDAKKIRQRLMDAIETAAFPGQDEDEVNRLLSMVVVGGGPTGVEYAAELYDFLVDDLLVWYPDLAPKLNITLIEAMPRVLPMFNKTLIEYTEKLFKERSINVKNNTAVKQVNPTNVIVEDRTNKETYSVPFGLLVWAAGNKPRPLISNLIKDIGPEYQDQRYI
jgi:NADH:ubiquinone reductase (non-electrogenic)